MWEIRWTNQPFNSGGGVDVPQMEYLGDGRIALHFPNEGETNRFYPNIRIINLEGEVLVEQNYRYLTQNSVSYVGDIRKTNDGNILICGRYFDKMVTEDDLSLNANAFVSKMSRDGEIEWFRHFRQEESDGEPVWSGFSSLLTLSDNSIVAVGNIERSPSDLLIMKLDENGCFGPNDCGGGVVTDVEEVVVEDTNSIKVYPNPILGDKLLTIETLNHPNLENGKLSVTILDIHGQKLINKTINQESSYIDISSLSSGMHIVIIKNHQNRKADRIMMRIIIVIILVVGGRYSLISQDTWSIIIGNDTLTEVAREVAEIDGSLYVINRTRCQPDAQSCGVLLKYDQKGNFIQEAKMPFVKIGNDNIIHQYKENIIVTGRSNDGEIPLRYGFYEIDTMGNILDFTDINLPYESNFNYGSLIKGDTLYMYGTGREDFFAEGINVDALIVTYDLVQDTFSYEYFDYGHDFVDIWDMRMIEDGSILFYSAISLSIVEVA